MSNGEICHVDGCSRKAMYLKDKLCQMHYFRRMRTGSFDKRQSSLRYKHSAGYVLLHLPFHPLADSKGNVFEHRVRMYEKYGENIPSCELCNKPTNWRSRNTHVDHIDCYKANNDPSNLRILCNGCNVRRVEKVHHLYDHCTAITIGDLTMTANEWSKRPDVVVSNTCIHHRLKRGMSHYDAVYSTRKTHNGVKEKPPAPPKYTRKNAVRITIGGVTMTAAEWSRSEICAVDRGTIINRLRSGMDHLSAVTIPPTTGPHKLKELRQSE